MTHKEWRKACRAAFDLACLEWHIQCAVAIIRLAPVSEFVNAVEVLKNYRDGFANRDDLKRAYSRLRNLHKKSGYGYTALGEISLGLQGVLYSTLHPRREVWSCDCQRFTEACYLAAEVVAPTKHGWEWASRAQHESHEFQQKQYHEIFDAHNAKWSEYKPEVSVAAA
jgi:hypothetical protein